MPTRDSEGIWLDILAAPPAVDVGLEVDVYDGSSPGASTMLATLEKARDVQFQIQENDGGAFSFLIPVSDPKATIAPGNLTRGNVVRIKLGGIYRFEGEISTTKVVPASADGPQQESWFIGGKGSLNRLRRGQVYPAGYPTGKNPTVPYAGVTAAGLLLDQIAQAQARTPRPALTEVAPTFTATHDSRGFPWPDLQTLNLNAGTSLLALAQQLSALAFDIRMRPFFRLDAYVLLGTDHSADGDPQNPVILALGRHLGLAGQDISVLEVDEDLVTRVLVQGAGGLMVEVVNALLESDPQIGRREGFLDYSSGTTVDALNSAGLAALAAVQNEAQPLSIGVLHGPSRDLTGEPTGDYEPFVDYDVGDWVTIDVPGTVYARSKQRIVSITIAQIQDSANYKVALDLNSVYLEEIIRLSRRSGGSVNAGGGSSSSLDPSGGGAKETGRVALAVGDTPDFLESKLVEGAGVTLTPVGPVGNQQLEVAAAGAGGPTLRTVRLTAALLVSPAPAVDTLIPGMTITVPGSATARTVVVSGSWTHDGGHPMRARLYLDGAAEYPRGGGQLGELITDSEPAHTGLLAGVPVDIPGDSAAHDIEVWWQAQGSAGGVTLYDRALTVLDPAA